MSSKVSVIIPIYKSNNTDKCLESIINQTYKNLEIIFVNINNYCIDIIKKYTDIRIKVINCTIDNNFIISNANNAALRVATGEYIFFVNTDDFIDSKYIESLVRNIQNVDFVENVNIIQQKTKPNIFKKIYKYLFCDEVVTKTVKNNNVLNTMYNKLYRKSFFNTTKLLFPESEFYNLYFINCLKMFSDSFSVIQNPRYHYNKLESSEKNTDCYIDLIDALFKKENNFTNVNKVDFYVLFLDCILNSNDKNKILEKAKEVFSKESVYNKIEMKLVENILNSKDYNDFIAKYQNDKNIFFIKCFTKNRKRFFKLFDKVTLLRIDYSARNILYFRLFGFLTFYIKKC